MRYKLLERVLVHMWRYMRSMKLRSQTFYIHTRRHLEMLKIAALFFLILLSATFLSCEIDLDRGSDVEDEIARPRISAEELMDTWVLWTVDKKSPAVDLVDGRNVIEGSLATLVFVDKERYTFTIDYSLSTGKIASGYIFVVWRAEGTYKLSGGTLTFLTIEWSVGVRSLGVNMDEKVLAKNLKEEFDAFRAGAIHDLEWTSDDRTSLLTTKQGIGTKYLFRKETALFEQGSWEFEPEYFYDYDE